MALPKKCSRSVAVLGKFKKSGGREGELKIYKNTYRTEINNRGGIHPFWALKNVTHNKDYFRIVFIISITFPVFQRCTLREMGNWWRFGKSL